MDPIGFAMENFDAVGQWRTMDGDTAIDAKGVLVDGSKLDGVKDMRAALLRYSPQFVRVITEKLFIYGLGRGTEYYDMPLVRSIVHDAEHDGYRFSALVLGVVKSDAFQMNQKLQSSAPSGAGLRPANASLDSGAGLRPANGSLDSGAGLRPANRSLDSGAGLRPANASLE